MVNEIAGGTTRMQIKAPENEYVMLDPNRTTILYSDTLRLTVETTGETKTYNQEIVKVGRHPTNDYVSDNIYIARFQATFYYEHQTWFLQDNGSTNGTYINGKRIEAGKKYQLASNDKISFAYQETVVFDRQIISEQSNEDKALAVLKIGMYRFTKSEYKDEVAFKLILAALAEVPVYFPMEIDLSALFGNIDPTQLKAGDAIQAEKDVRMRICTLVSDNGVEVVPMFTSNEEASGGMNTSLVRFYPQDYLPKIIGMKKPIVVNPFSESRVLLDVQIIENILWPAAQEMKKKEPVNTKVKKVYEGMNKDLRDEVFYGGILGADEILTDLATKVFGNVNAHHIDCCFQIYVQTWVRLHGGFDPMFSTRKYIKQALCERFSGIDSTIISKCVDYSVDEIYRREPELQKRIEG